MRRKKIFISYDNENDRHYKNLLLAWDSNKQFDFLVGEISEKKSNSSIQSKAINSVITQSINDAVLFLVIIGKNTHKSQWVCWEIEKAHQLGKKIVAVKTKRANITPSILYNIGVSWAMSFNYESIINAINNA